MTSDGADGEGCANFFGNNHMLDIKYDAKCLKFFINIPITRKNVVNEIEIIFGRFNLKLQEGQIKMSTYVKFIDWLRCDVDYVLFVNSNQSIY